METYPSYKNMEQSQFTPFSKLFEIILYNKKHLSEKPTWIMCYKLSMFLSIYQKY